jgi:hypothetical protein
MNELVWSENQPTEPGWYWYRAREHKEWPVEVIGHGQNMRVRYEWGWLPLSQANKTSEFAGPLPKPKEPGE